MKIPGDAWCWLCKRSYTDTNDNLRCGRDGSMIRHGEEVWRAKDCGCYLSPVDVNRGDKDDVKQYRR